MKSILKQLWSSILPLTVIVIVPWLIEDNFSVEVSALSFAGIIFIIAGLLLMSITISMFIRIGKGTLAPWSPTQKLIVTGVYAHVRNPMISGVLIVLLGESMMFGSVNILIWALAFFTINTFWFIMIEEPGLKKRFGEDYEEYKRNVPMWIPRRKPWIQPDHSQT